MGKNAFNSRNTNCCLECLKENLYFRKLWELTIYNICYKHNCRKYLI
ncbi:TniQ family protein, partial [Neobacillus drentensis]